MTPTLSSTPNPIRRLATVIAVQITSHPMLSVTAGGTESRQCPEDILVDLIFDLLTAARVHVAPGPQPTHQTDPMPMSEPQLLTNPTAVE